MLFYYLRMCQKGAESSLIRLLMQGQFIVQACLSQYLGVLKYVSFLELHFLCHSFRYPKMQMLASWKCLFVAIFTPLMIWYTVAAVKVKKTPLLETVIKQISLGNIEFDFQTSLYFFKSGGEVYLRGSMPDILHEKGPPTHCGSYNISKHLCVIWYSLVKLEVLNLVEEHGTCQRLKWTPTFNHYSPETCFSMAEANWYGGSLLSHQVWPLNKAHVPLQSYQTHDLREYAGEATVIGNGLDWFWISSKGVGIILDSQTPVLISVNQSGNHLLCFQASGKVIKPVLMYTVCRSSSLKKIHRYIMNRFVELPKHHLPDENFFLKPLWSTTAVFDKTVNQANVLSYAKEIGDKGFSKYLFEIIDTENASVDDVFYKGKFPNSHQMLMYVREYGFRSYIGMTPFVFPEEEFDKSKLLLNKDSKSAVTLWGREKMNILDLHSSETKQWFVNQLKNMVTEYGIDGFTLLGGESNYLINNNAVSDANSLELTKDFLSISEDLKITPLSSFSYKSQHLAGVVTLSHRKASWDSHGGLRSVIPSVLTLGILGYPFIIPNVVGGFGQFKKVNSTYSELEKPDRELYIRWMEIAAYMPCMMFSIPPWYYDEEVATLARELTKLHEKTVGPLVLKAAREYENTGKYYALSDPS